MKSNLDPEALLPSFEAGEIFAYPTEAVYGLGCDPDQEQAVLKLLALKKRPIEKGLILIAKTYSQLLPYIDDAAIPMFKRTEIFSSWPGPNTWLLPASKKAPKWITGGSDLIAVRVTSHPLVQELCECFNKPIVSTSANITGQPAATTVQQIEQQFAQQVIIVAGELGNRRKPSCIRNGLTGQTIRDN
ncbi:Sua5/YciO/YrdC/YwlC family protein [Paraglaciecola aquimarina]|uniref:Threonylcarbamoyl-AMP synthase n=1 Tax=Paraglaciecola algarum TaxID=3050085 RepID=A0ABS9D2M4_9ALTE|nr:Sua5/YciO/YrdC/YwlC family protein [Paraglaciecola sp. G1-23]MCF2947176.1 Sua5/YciO/YrdC/YwlC family protein [Paraglaciecola sp. G1-23]